MDTVGRSGDNRLLSLQMSLTFEIGNALCDLTVLGYDPPPPPPPPAPPPHTGQ